MEVQHYPDVPKFEPRDRSKDYGARREIEVSGAARNLWWVAPDVELAIEPFDQA